MSGWYIRIEFTAQSAGSLLCLFALLLAAAVFSRTLSSSSSSSSSLCGCQPVISHHATSHTHSTPSAERLSTITTLRLGLTKDSRDHATHTASQTLSHSASSVIRRFVDVCCPRALTLIMYRLPLTCLLLTLAFAPLNHALVPPAISSPFATLLPAISSALRDLSAVDSDDASYLRLARRHVHFMLSAMVSPLQLLDWSHWSTDPSTSVTNSYSLTAATDDDWQADEVDFALHGDPSHLLRASVNAHRQPAEHHTPHHSHVALQPTPSNDSASLPPPPATVAASTALHLLSTTYSADNHTNSSVTVATIGELADTCLNGGIPVRFNRYINRTGRYDDITLCYCPADYVGITCFYRRSYRCQVRLADDATNACTAVRGTAVPTLYTSHSERLTNVHVASSSSDYYTYEPTLSGPVAPCLSLTNERPTLNVSFTCHFINGAGGNTVAVEGFDAARLAYQQSRGYQLNDTLPLLRYTVKNVAGDAGTASGAMTFAVSGAVRLSLSVRLHNTAHPSQFLQTVSALTAAQLQYDAATNQTQPLSVLADVTTIDRNLKRGGRLLMALRWHDITAGLVIDNSGLPWQLTVEDGTWELPGPNRRVWVLSGWQTAGLVVVVVIVVLLWLWRWWQRRQTIKMQELLAEQRGRQQSWFTASQ